MYELGGHISHARTLAKVSITPLQRDFIKKPTRENLMHLRIHHTLGREFALPRFRHLERCKTSSITTATLASMATTSTSRSWRPYDAPQLVGVKTITTPSRSLNTTPSLACPMFGNGSDARPFLVGMSTKALLRNVTRDLGAFVLHLDAMFKLNCVGYPVLVCGFTDVSRTFHLVALFITSQLQGGHYAAALITLRRMYAQVNGVEMVVKIVLGDADQAQHNVFRQVFTDSNFNNRMCFYHVVAKLHEKARGLGTELSALVFRGIYDLHFSLNEAEFSDRKAAMIQEWDGVPDLRAFSAYVKVQWLHGTFIKWQCYHNSTGYATTNNPVEQFNRALRGTTPIITS